MDSSDNSGNAHQRAAPRIDKPVGPILAKPAHPICRQRKHHDAEFLLLKHIGQW